jgi:hypothetical protein
VNILGVATIIHQPNTGQSRLSEMKANWIGHILRRNRRLKHITEENIEGKIKMT